MKELQYDETNPWHENAHLMFGFQCYMCNKVINAGDIDEKDSNIDFLKFCVLISNKAQELGWQYIDDFSFICPKCSRP